jgi:hypothetical protein
MAMSEVFQLYCVIVEVGAIVDGKAEGGAVVGEKVMTSDLETIINERRNKTTFAMYLIFI